MPTHRRLLSVSALIAVLGLVLGIAQAVQAQDKT